MFAPTHLRTYLEKMRTDWDARARANANHYIADGKTDWTREEFYRSGIIDVEGHILTDLENICRGKDPREMKILELGCGAGRVTRALAAIFGEVHAVDVSPEMLKLASEALAGCPGVHLYQTDGATLNALGDRPFDFAFSCCVFHHISSYDVIRSYVRDVGRRLTPGALFKFEVQGCTDVQTSLVTPGLASRFQKIGRVGWLKAADSSSVIARERGESGSGSGFSKTDERGRALI